MNIAVFVLTGAVTALGVAYFCVDLYHNRNKHRSHFEPIADITGVECSPNAMHGVEDASHSIGDGVGHCIEAIAHTLSHH
jgi:hypothetical protein